MDRSALPYLYYLIVLSVGLAYFGFIGHLRRRKIFLAVFAWFLAEWTRDFLIVASTDDALFARTTVIAYIRCAVWVAATAVAIVIGVSAQRDIDFRALWRACVTLVRSILGRVRGLLRKKST